MDEEILNDLLSRLGSDNPPGIDELTELRANLVVAFDGAAEPGDGFNLELARELRQKISDVDTEIARQRQVAEEAAAELEKLREGVELQGDGDGGDGDGDTEGTDDGDSGDTGGDGDGETDGDDDKKNAKTGKGKGKAKESVTAGNAMSAEAVRALQRVKRGPTSDGEDEARPPAVAVTVAGPALGARTPNSLQDVSTIFYNHAHRTSRGKQPLVQLAFDYPSNRRLTNGATENTRLIEDSLSLRSLVAAGGICDPLPADFSHPICGDRGRPIRDSLPAFNAGQGGVRYAPTATLDDLAGPPDAITIWTHDDDVAGTGTKPCPHVDCEPEVEVFVDAVVACLEVGNFQARFNPEFWRAQLDLLMIRHDRIAERTLFATMQALSTAVTFASVDGNTVQTLFLGLDRAAAGIRSRHRILAPTLRFVAPTWLRDAIRASLVRGHIEDPDMVAVADAVINTFFATRNITPVWSPDIDLFGAQAAGPINNWPGDDATTLLYPEGTFFFLDGGTLDLGTEIRDSTLNATNDRQAFMETFENVAFRGCEALAITFPVGEDCVCSVGDILAT